MLHGAFKSIAGILLACAAGSGTLAHAWCNVAEFTVNGRVEDAPAKASVRVQLVYANQKTAESGEATLEDGSFRIQIPFLTQSRAPLLVGTFREKCDRKPKTIVVTLIEGDQEYDHISLDMAKDFRRDEADVYALRSQIVLHGPARTAPVR
jgi:hypothetical protein